MKNPRRRIYSPLLYTTPLFSTAMSSFPFHGFLTNSVRIQRLLSFCRVRRKPKPPAATTSFSSMTLPTQLKHVFTLIDTNGDGKISPEELLRLLLRLGHDSSTAEREAVGMVAVVDLDGDGAIGFEEFVQAVGGGDDEEVVVEAFRVFDRDGDGVITARELRKVMSELMGRRWCSKRECSEIIRRVDRNGDGVVDLEEFRWMMRVG